MVLDNGLRLCTTLLGVTLASFLLSIIKGTSECSWYFIVSVLTFGISLFPMFSKIWDTKPSDQHNDLDLFLNGSFFEMQDEKISLKSLESMCKSVSIRFIVPLSCTVVLYPFGGILFRFIKKLFIFLDVAFDMKIMMVFITPLTLFILNEIYGHTWREDIETRWFGRNKPFFSGTKFAVRNPVMEWAYENKGYALGALKNKR